MDRDMEKFLINTLSTSFTNIGVALRLLLEARADKEEEKIITVREIENQTKEIPEEKKEQTEKKPSVKQKAKKTVEATKREEVTEVETPVTEETLDTEQNVAAPALEKAKTEGPAKNEESRHKTTLIDVRKIMTDLTKRGKGDIIQNVLTKDFKVSKLSDVKEEDYDDFVARVQYYADELEVEHA